MDTKRKIKNANSSQRKDNKKSSQKKKVDLAKVQIEEASSSPPKGNGHESSPPNKENGSSSSNNQPSRFDWLKVILQPTILAALIGILWSSNESRVNNLRYQRDLVSNYIDAVQTLLMDQFYESEDRYPDRIPKPMDLFIKSKVGESKQVALFIRSKAGTTLKRLEDQISRDTLLSFLRRANIGFLPRSGDLTQVDTLEDIIYISKTGKSKSLQYSDLLRGIDLSQTTLNNSDFAFVVFREADLIGASFIETTLSQANLRKSRLTKADLRGANLLGTDFREADLREAKFQKSPYRLSSTWPWIAGKKRTILYKTNLRGANLQKANLRGADLTGANLIYAQLIDREGDENNKALINEETSFTYALYAPNNGTKFSEQIKAKLDSEDLCMIAIKPGLNLPAFLETEDCRKQDKLLQKTTFAQVNFSEQETAFDEVDPFRETDLSRTNLQGAILAPNVDFLQTNLAEANLAKANLAKAINLTPSQIKSACNWQQATYKAEYDKKKETWVTLEPDNTKFIEELEKDKSSDPQKPVDCNKWN